VANAYLEGTYSEVYPNISQDEEGMKRLFKQFSFPAAFQENFIEIIELMHYIKPPCEAFVEAYGL